MRRMWRAMIVLVLIAAGATPAAARDHLAPRAQSTPREVRLPDETIILAVSPDGQSLVGFESPPTGGKRLCIYEVASSTERACADLAPHEISPMINGVAWSPDGQWTAIVDGPWGDLADGDLWVMEAGTGELTNLTDDGYDGVLPLDEEPDSPVYLDSFPVWAPDSSAIAFFRTTAVADGYAGSQIALVNRASGEIETLVSISPDAVSLDFPGVAWAPDGQRLYYSVFFAAEPDHPKNGVWVYDVADQTTTRILPYDPDLGPAALIDVAATGQTALIVYPYLLRIPGERDYYALLDLDTNRLAPVHTVAPDPAAPAIVIEAAYSPDGTRVVYVLRRYDGETRLVERELPQGQPNVIAGALNLDGPLVPITAGGGLFWASNGTIFLATDANARLLFPLATEQSPR